MPPKSGPRPGKKSRTQTIKSASTKKKNHRQSVAKDANNGATAAAANAARRNPKNVPAPAAVLMQALGLPLTAGSTNGDTENESADGQVNEGAEVGPLAQMVIGGPSPFVAGMEVEVETVQGYLYTGKLAVLDAHYNVLLHESLVRRARAFDFERAVEEEQRQTEARLIASSLQGGSYSEAVYEVGAGGSATRAGAHASQVMDRLPRPRYIGTVSLRSNNMVLMRFIPSVAVGSGAAESAWDRLQKSFSGMAVAIKVHLQQEKMRKRAARRKRLAAKRPVSEVG